MKGFQLIHTTRDDAGTWLWESLHAQASVPKYFRRRQGQTARTEVTWDEVRAAMTPREPEQDWSQPEPASVWEQPSFGPRRAR